MKVLVAVKRVVDYAVKVRVKPDKTGESAAVDAASVQPHGRHGAALTARCGRRVVSLFPAGREAVSGVECGVGVICRAVGSSGGPAAAAVTALLPLPQPLTALTPPRTPSHSVSCSFPCFPARVHASSLHVRRTVVQKMLSLFKHLLKLTRLPVCLSVCLSAVCVCLSLGRSLYPQAWSSTTSRCQ